MQKVEKIVDALLGKFTDEFLREKTKSRVRSFLLNVCGADSIIPSVVPIYDGDSAVLYWMVGDRSLEVEIDSTGAVYYSSIDDDSHVESIEEPEGSIIDATIKYIGDLQRRVMTLRDPLG